MNVGGVRSPIRQSKCLPCRGRTGVSRQSGCARLGVVRRTPIPHLRSAQKALGITPWNGPDGSGDFLFVAAGIPYALKTFMDNLKAWVIFFRLEEGYGGLSANLDE